METSWSDSTPVADATPAPDNTGVGDTPLSVDSAPLESTYDSAPLESTYDSAPLESTYDSAPLESTYDTTEIPDEDHDDIKAALEEYGFDTSDYGRGNKSFNSQEVGRLTDVSSTEAAKAGHDARDHMSEDPEMGIPKNRHGE